MGTTETTLETLLVDTADGIAVVTINRPDVRNALSRQVLADLHSALADFRDDDTVGAVVFTGAGEKAFIAGADISQVRSYTMATGLEGAMQRAFDEVEAFEKPTIAAVNGFALGGGCELAMACTIRIAADTAKLGQPEINLGIIPGYGGSQRLSRLVGRGRALELLLTGDQISAAEAYRLGLVNRVVTGANLMGEARKIAQALAAKAPIAVRYIIDAVNKGLQMPLPDAQVFEATLFGLVAATEDMREGTKAFLEKRKPEFKGK